MVKGTEMKCWRRSLDLLGQLDDQQTNTQTRLLTKTFFQTTKTPKMIFENNTWPHLAKAVLGKAVKEREIVVYFPRIQSAQVSCLTSDLLSTLVNAAKTSSRRFFLISHSIFIRSSMRSRKQFACHPGLVRV